MSPITGSRPRLTSLDVKLPLFISALLALVVGVLAGVAYQQVRRTTLAAAAARLSEASNEIVMLLTAGAPQRLREAQQEAAQPSLPVFLRNPRTGPALAVATLRAVAADSLNAAVELWNAAGERLLAVGHSIPASDIAAARAFRPVEPQPAVFGPLRRVGDAVLFPVMGTVRDGGRTAGYLVRWRSVTVAPGTAQGLAALIGPDAALLVGNAADDVWTDLVRPVAGPSVDLRAIRGVVQYRRSDRDVVAFVRPMVTVPWVLVAELPRDRVVAPIGAFLRRIALMALILLAAGAVGAWGLSRAITQPLRRLTAATQQIERGDYSARFGAGAGSDEVAALGHAFDDMASSLQGASAALGRSEDRYRMLFESNPLASWVLDTETLRFLAVNEAAVSLYGYTRDEFLSMTARDIRPPDQVPRFLASMGESLAGVRLSADWTHRKKDGTQIDVEVSAHQVEFEGRPAMLALMMDITERKRADDALRMSERRFRQLAEHINEAFFVIEMPSGQPLYVSPTWAEIWGRSVDDAYANPQVLMDAVHPDDRALLFAGRSAIMRGEPATDVFRLRRPDGSERWVRGRRFPVLDSAGAVYRMVGVAEDITELRKTEEQLLKAQKMEAVGRLAGGIAHDFNNVLTAIFGYVEMVIDDLPRGGQGRADLEEVLKAAGRAASLTRQLLAFSRQQVLQPTVLQINDVVQDLEKILRRVIGEDLELRVTLAPDAGKVRADVGQLEQVVLNLAVNARDAMPTGGKLTIETVNAGLTEAYADAHQPVVPGAYVMLAVSDTGVGMSPEVRARIFEPFFTTKEKGKGTGLGLSTVYGIVKQSGGYVWVYSEPGQGATFKIYLPRVDAPIDVAPRPKEGGTLAGTETVLMAEDDDLLRPLAQNVLEKFGYTVLAAANADAALASASGHQGPIHLLVSDVVMPGASGRELARRLAATHPETKVLFVSGYTDDAIVHHGMLEPGLNYLQKPFTPATLARKVREVLDAG